MALDNYFGSRLMALGTAGAEQIYNAFMGYMIATGYRILSRTTTAPPGTPALLDTYLVPTGATDDWSGLDGQFVFWQNAWVPVSPQAGFQFYIVDEVVWVHMHTNNAANAHAISGTHDIPLVDVAGSDHIIWDGSKAVTANVSLTNDCILDTPTNFMAGQHYMLRVTQDNTGGWSVTPAIQSFVVGPGDSSPLDGIAGLAANRSADIYIIGAQGGILARPAIYLVILDVRLVEIP